LISPNALVFAPFKSQMRTGDNPAEVCNKTGPIGEHEMDVVQAAGVGATDQDGQGS
jgi:hypothetical protein